jgi:hypothetical protein
VPLALERPGPPRLPSQADALGAAHAFPQLRQVDGVRHLPRVH